MHWLHVLTIVGSNIVLALMCMGSTITLFLWARSEARQDQQEMRGMLNAIQQEMKDFHARMYALEEKYLKKRQ